MGCIGNTSMPELEKAKVDMSSKLMTPEEVKEKAKHIYQKPNYAQLEWYIPETEAYLDELKSLIGSIESRGSCNEENPHDYKGNYSPSGYRKDYRDGGVVYVPTWDGTWIINGFDYRQGYEAVQTYTGQLERVAVGADGTQIRMPYPQGMPAEKYWSFYELNFLLELNKEKEIEVGGGLKCKKQNVKGVDMWFSDAEKYFGEGKPNRAPDYFIVNQDYARQFPYLPMIFNPADNPDTSKGLFPRPTEPARPMIKIPRAFNKGDVYFAIEEYYDDIQRIRHNHNPEMNPAPPAKHPIEFWMDKPPVTEEPKDRKPKIGDEDYDEFLDYEDDTDIDFEDDIPSFD